MHPAGHRQVSHPQGAHGEAHLGDVGRASQGRKGGEEEEESRAVRMRSPRCQRVPTKGTSEEGLGSSICCSDVTGRSGTDSTGQFVTERSFCFYFRQWIASLTSDADLDRLQKELEPCTRPILPVCAISRTSEDRTLCRQSKPSGRDPSSTDRIVSRSPVGLWFVSRFSRNGFNRRKVKVFVDIFSTG